MIVAKSKLSLRLEIYQQKIVMNRKGSTSNFDILS